MKNIFCYSFILLVFSTASPNNIMAQRGRLTPCEEIRREADFIEELRREEYQDHLKLKGRFRRKMEEARNQNLNIPEGTWGRKRIPDPSAPQYRDHRGRCVQENKSWGTILDLREYKYDSLSLANDELEKRIAWLDKKIQGKEEDVESRFIDWEREEIRNLGSLEETLSLSAQRASFAMRTYSYCIYDPSKKNLKIKNRQSSRGKHGFDSLEELAYKQKRELVFAMNAGMFKPNKQAVGLLVSNNRILSPLNTREGKGNFYMQPNGVFAIMQNGEAIIKKTSYFKEQRYLEDEIKLATQSGPIMLLNRKINPKFSRESQNYHFRNAVGIDDQGQVIFAISEQPVSFYEFSYFLKKLNCTYALYLDGSVAQW